MDKLERIAVLRNDIEAGLLDAVLAEQDIPHLMQSYYDAAYDGVFQHQKGWGCVRAPEVFRAKIIDILEDLRRNADATPEEESKPFS